MKEFLLKLITFVALTVGLAGCSSNDVESKPSASLQPATPQIVPGAASVPGTSNTANTATNSAP